MTDQMFKKAVTLTDVHFGRAGNSPVANQDNLDFIDWFIEEARTWGADTCLMLGDWHENRANLHVQTLYYSLEGMQRLNDAFAKVIWLPGNHDLLYRHKRDVSSIEFARHLPNIQIIREPTTIGEVSLLPWLVGDEAKAVKNIKSRYVFGHLELPGYLLNAKVPMPHHNDGITSDDFKGGAEYVFSGHFHFRQAMGDNPVVYTGNIMPFNFADVDDSDRGMMFLEWGSDPFFKAWPDQPLFTKVNLSELLSAPQRFLKPKMTVRVITDIEINHEEARTLKDTFEKEYDLRKIEYAHAPKQESDQKFVTEINFQSVDQIVIDGLLSVESTGLSPNRLVEIYRSLPDL
jgi:DNA repair exonuclease SbcCD nuclease subunit